MSPAAALQDPREHEDAGRNHRSDASLGGNDLNPEGRRRSVAAPVACDYSVTARSEGPLERTLA